jgi:hypothetical protein
VVGRPDHWTKVLTHLALDLGFGTFVLMGQPDPQMLRTFIEDVAPRVRERVATARALTGAAASNRPPTLRRSTVSVGDEERRGTEA